LARFTLLFAFMTVLASTQIGCGGGSSPTSPSSSSGSGNSTSTSHNAGRDCTSCHGFTVAGTAYKADGDTPYPGVTVRLTAERLGGSTVVATLTSDGSGNFYTGAIVDFGAGLSVTVTSGAGNASSMTAAITSGACNRCHTTGSRVVVQ
jgi:hypothetical protein